VYKCTYSRVKNPENLKRFWSQAFQIRDTELEPKLRLHPNPLLCVVSLVLELFLFRDLCLPPPFRQKNLASSARMKKE
jgi:hypothetical protein